MRRLLLIIAFAPVAAFAATPCDSASYPGFAWRTTAKQTAEVKKAEIDKLEEYAFTLTGTDDERLGLRTDALVIIKGGEIIYEKYARGWDETKPHISWSVAKSVSSALTGVAVLRAGLKVDQSICDVLEGYSGAVCKVKVGHLLEFSSGIDWQEEYENESYQVSSVISMFFGEGHHDMLGFILGHRSYAEPGTKWRYSTGESTVLAAVAKRALSKVYGADDYAWKALFDRLGMKGVTLEEDVKGTPLGGSHLFATARDYARFGYLYLHDGCWAGERILPEGWVKGSTEPSPAFTNGAPAEEKTPNGWMWWTNRVAGGATEKPWKDAPDDAYSAIGHWGQYVIVVPSADVVIVRTGDDRSASVSLSKLISLSLEVAR